MRHCKVLVLLLITLPFISCNKTSFKAQAAQIPETFLPIFSIPKIDRVHGNELFGLSVHIKEETVDSRRIEYTILFKDEDHPTKLFDFFYDIFRSFKYRRVIDVETFFINFHKNQDDAWKPTLIEYPTVYGKSQRFFEKDVKHFSISLQEDVFDYQQQRIVMYVNTWNHMFSNVDTNPELDKEQLSSYPVFQGSRSDVDAYFK